MFKKEVEKSKIFHVFGLGGLIPHVYSSESNAWTHCDANENAHDILLRSRKSDAKIQGSLITKATFNNKNKARGITMSDRNTLYVGAVIKTTWL